MASRTGFTASTLAEKLRKVGFASVDVKVQDDNAIWATSRKGNA